MEELLQQFPDREAFDFFLEENYTPLVYEDVKEGFAEVTEEEGAHIFPESDMDQVTRDNFMEYLGQGARFILENAMTEAFYEKNPEVYEAAFGLYEADPEHSGQITESFHQKYQDSYKALLLEWFDAVIAPLLGDSRA